MDGRLSDGDRGRREKGRGVACSQMLALLLLVIGDWWCFERMQGSLGGMEDMLAAPTTFLFSV